MHEVKASMMNAIHDLPLLVARDEGFFRDQGLDVEIVRTPGSGQRDSDHQRCGRTSSIAPWRRSTTRALRPVPHVRVGRHEARGGVEPRRRAPAGEDRRARLGDVVVRHRHRAEVRIYEPEQLKTGRSR